jgi:hypothetical protein
MVSWKKDAEGNDDPRSFISGTDFRDTVGVDLERDLPV